MTEPFNGLRFDIYERVHLPDDVAAIEELEEIELVPHMQAVPQDDHVLLKGHLLLSGVYRAEASSEGVSQLEHWIPVEITLPMSRVDKVEDLAVQIDNFDVDLLSARSLNVTGVLALRGFQAAAPQIPIWRDDSFTVVHQAPHVPEPQHTQEEPAEEQRASQGTEPAETTEQAALSAPDAVSAFDQRPDSPYDTSIADYTPPYFPTSSFRESGVWPSAYQEPEAPEEPEPQPQSQQEYDLEQWIRAQEADASALYEPHPSQHETYSEDGYAADEVQEASGWGDSSTARPETDLWKTEDAAPGPEVKPEMKVAFGAQQPDAAVPIYSGVGLLTQLGEKGAVREAELQAIRSAQLEAEAEEAQDQKPSRMSTGDELEWTRLFLSRGADAQQFSRVKLCIVQREETLDAIAARYQVQSRELQLYNRLSDPYLSAGQVLYIP